jgi:hypothetical protein
MPLIITHGWPGSVIEMLDVIEPLPIRRRTAERRGCVPRRFDSGYFSAEPREVGTAASRRRGPS